MGAWLIVVYHNSAIVNIIIMYMYKALLQLRRPAGIKLLAPIV